MRGWSAGIGVLMALLVGCSASSPAARRTTRFEGKAFTLDLPAGWERVNDKFMNAVEAYTFSTTDGGFFSVAVDPAPSDGRGDAWWKTGARGDRLVILEESPPCRSEDEPQQMAYPCPAGDGALIVAAGDVVLRGHSFLFWFGNSKREKGVDLQPFRDILLSLRAK